MRPSIFRKSGWFSLLIINLLFGCKEIIEIDINTSEVILQAPLDSLVTTELSHRFSWHELEGATEYQLQIARPGFDAMERLELDTTLQDYLFDYTLYPSAFEWRVRALNGAYQSSFTTWHLFVDTTSDLSGMRVMLIEPSSGYITNQSEVFFKWEPIAIATDYHLEITDSESSGTIVFESDLSDNQIEVQLPNGKFKWRVYAFNSTPSSSNWSEERQMTNDTVPPSSPQLVYPLGSSSPVENGMIEFEFISGIDELTNTTDSLWIASDSLFTSTVRSTEATSPYSDSLGIGTFFWKVQTIDEAGNKKASNYQKFRIE